MKKDSGLSRRIREALESTTLYALAGRLSGASTKKVSRQNVRNWRDGMKPQRGVARIAAAALGMDVDPFIRGDPWPTSSERQERARRSSQVVVAGLSDLSRNTPSLSEKLVKIDELLRASRERDDTLRWTGDNGTQSVTTIYGGATYFVRTGARDSYSVPLLDDGTVTDIGHPADYVLTAKSATSPNARARARK